MFLLNMNTICVFNVRSKICDFVCVIQLPVFLLCLAIVHGKPLLISSSHLVRAPSHDSAIIRSDRQGGNFAYSTAESHAYAAVTPIVQKVVTPVAVSYAVPAPMIPFTPTSAYALESATLPKEHRGLTQSAPLSAPRRTIKS